MIVIPKKENKNAYALFNNNNNKNSIKFLDLNMNKIQWNIGLFHEVTQILKSFTETIVQTKDTLSTQRGICLNNISFIF